MSTVTRPEPRVPQPDATPPADRGRAQPATGPRSDGILGLAASLVLLATATVPLREVFLGSAWVRPVAGAALVSVGLAWGIRQLEVPAVFSAVASLGGWAVFLSVVFVRDTVVWGLLPTFDTLASLRVLAEQGRDLFLAQAAPVVPVAPLLLFAVTGVWLVGFLVTDRLLRRGGALLPIGVALVAFTFPLPLAPTIARATLPVVAFLAGSAFVLFVTGGSDGRAVAGHRRSSRPAARSRTTPMLSGIAVAAVAIGAGVALGDRLPGADEPPVYRIRGAGGTTVTTNPMVALRPNLTAEDRGPVMHVTSPRPVYLRTAALDHYDEFERWTIADRIRGASVSGGRLPPEVETSTSTGEITADIESASLRGVLVPVPYPPLEIEGETDAGFQYDRRYGIVTVAGGSELEPGDRYTVTSALAPDPAVLQRIEGYAVPDSQLTALPENVPEDVVDLAREIVTEAAAGTPFEMALAIQEELRTWTYSLEPGQGHGGDAMQAFIDNRIGYCEQFAGTMAVMLRTLDIPARVAVGFGPGDLVDPDEGRWSVSNANAHAWVEVLFPGHGWVAFEPTPRSDGNVLVPTPTNLTPADTAAADVAIADEDIPDAADDALVPDVDPADPEELPDGLQSPGSEEQDVAGGTGDGGWGSGRTIGLAVAAAALVGAAALVLAGRRTRSPHARARVLHARQRVEHLGRGLGLHPLPSDTDTEYLSRIGARVGREVDAGVLAAEAGRARFALAVAEDGARRAEDAASRLREAVPGSVRRAALTVRGATAGWLRALGGGRR